MTVIFQSACACRCEGIPHIIDSYRYSDIVVSGTVIASHITSRLDSFGVDITGDTASQVYKSSTKNWMIVDIQVDEVFKGDESAKVSIITHSSSAACGFSFQIGQQYVVYGERHFFYGGSRINMYSGGRNTYGTNHCMRTTSYPSAEIDLLKRYIKCGFNQGKDLVTAFGSSSVVFSGTVLAVISEESIFDISTLRLGDLKARNLNFPEDVCRYFLVKVDRYYKGDSSYHTVVVATPDLTQGCGVSLSAGDRYIIYSDRIVEYNSLPLNKSYHMPILWTSIRHRTFEHDYMEEAGLRSLVK